MGPHAVELGAPPGVRPVFHVNLVRRAGTDPLPSQEQHDTERSPIAVEEATEDAMEGEYRIEAVVDHRRRGRGFQVLVRWVGWAEPSWEPLTRLGKTKALEEYEATALCPWEGRRGDYM